jgi:DNA-binding response OmpR family regulator
MHPLSSRFTVATAVPESLEPSTGTPPSVLLIEEYDALAAALTSALKKFAPQHRTRVVESLSEAESAAAETRPQLFVIDFDPPHQNAIEFLNRMRTAHPDARLLAIASGTSLEFAALRYGPNAIQFVEKPFELADFGAAVQALLGPWTEASSGGSRGTLRDLNLRDLVPLECVSAATAVLEITATGERAGQIHFLDGHICHASAPGLSGVDALSEILRWKDAWATERERAVDGPRTIQGPWLHVFLEALRTAKPDAEELTAPSPPVSPKPARTGKKIVVIDDTEMLLIFVEDSLSIADPSLQIITALTGSEGASRAEAVIPDLVLLDYSLPDLRGDEICERLLRNEATARIPVVMMSGHVPEMMATAERYPNVVATIAKPFMSEALVQLVNETLAKGALLPKEKAAVTGTVADQPSSALHREPKPVRHGNGKKPAKKSAPSKSSAKNLPESPISSLPAPIGLAPPPPVPETTIQVPESIAKGAAIPPAAHSPVPSDIRPAESALFDPLSLPFTRPGKVAREHGAVILGLGIDVMSVQFTPRFQVATIRAKPSTMTLSLVRRQMPFVAKNRWGAGFELGIAELDSNGQIRTMRVRPTHRPAESIRTHKGFDINDVKLVNEAACIQFTAGASTPMTMQLVAFFKVAGVELSDRFEVAQMILQSESSRVRITLDPQASGTAGMEFETVSVRLDASSRIAEFVLSSFQSDQTERRIHVA